MKLPGCCALLLLALPVSTRANTVVLLDTVLGPIEVELFDAVTPLTVANFLFYVDGGDYDQSFVHRSVPAFVIQGGGYRVEDNQTVVVAENPPTVANEPGVSNLRTTIAMAKVDGDPDSATTQWFVNVEDNPELDTTNGGFTVFGEVVSGMAVVDAINALPRVNAGGPFTQLPVRDYAGGPVAEENLVLKDVLRTPFVQCGDLDPDGAIDASDVARLRTTLAALDPPDPGEFDRCSVIGTPDDCDVADLVVLRRRQLALAPKRQALCPAATGP